MMIVPNHKFFVLPLFGLFAPKVSMRQIENEIKMSVLTADKVKMDMTNPPCS